MSKKYLTGLVAVIALLVVLLVITKRGEERVGSDKLMVSASFYPLYFFASEIGGEKVVVENITPAGVEPHDYEPTAPDMVKIQNSGVLVLNGAGLEVWGENIKKNVDSKKTLVITVGEDLATEKIMEEGENIIDPHIWLSPTLANKMVEGIESALTKTDPSNSAYYRSGAKALKSKLNVLDSEYKNGLQNCRSKNIITSHAAFGYLANTYDLKQVAISGVSPEEEPSPRELAEVAKFAKENKVKYIFFESLLSPKLSQTIAREVGAQTLVLNPLEGLSSEEIAEGKNYFTEMRSNLANLKIALECK